jgi:hypothetical protein
MVPGRPHSKIGFRDTRATSWSQAPSSRLFIMPTKSRRGVPAAAKRDAADFVARLGKRLAERGVDCEGVADVAALLKSPFTAAVQQVAEGTPLRAALEADSTAHLSVLVAMVSKAKAAGGKHAGDHVTQRGTDGHEAWLSGAVVEDAIQAAGAAAGADSLPLCKSWPYQ